MKNLTIKYEVRKCRCCFPFYCGHKKIIISNMDYELLLMTLKYSKLIENEKPKTNHT